MTQTQTPEATKIPAWHLPMIRDTHRNELLRRAIQAAVRPGDRVVDLGAGSGLLALIAARAGAGAVYAVESHPLTASALRKTIAVNGFAAQITVIEKSIGETTLADIGGAPADVVISETIGSYLFDEGILDHVHHASTHLAKPDARLLPSAVRLKAAFVDAGAIGRFDIAHQPRSTLDFNLEAYLEALNPGILLPFFEADALRLKGREIALGEFPLTARPPLEAQGVFQTSNAMTVDGAMVWGEWVFGDDHVLTVGPGGLANSWAHYFVRGDGRRLEAGQSLDCLFRMAEGPAFDFFWWLREDEALSPSGQ